MKIPDWLGHLRTDRRGRPVPFINRWGGEDAGRIRIDWDPAVGMAAVFYDETGQTEPDFTAQHMARQRQCMTQGLCQVCARPVPWSRRRLVVSGISLEHVVVAGLGPRWVVTEPWLDDRCAEFALRVCPALIRRRRDEHLVLVEVTSRRHVELVVSRGWVEGPLEAESRRVRPAMWVKALVDERLVTIRHHNQPQVPASP